MGVRTRKRTAGSLWRLPVLWSFMYWPFTWVYSCSSDKWVTYLPAHIVTTHGTHPTSSMIDTYPPTWVVTNVGWLSTMGSDTRKLSPGQFSMSVHNPGSQKNQKITQISFNLFSSTKEIEVGFRVTYIQTLLNPIQTCIKYSPNGPCHGSMKVLSLMPPPFPWVIFNFLTP